MAAALTEPAHAERWAADGVSLADVQRALADLRRPADADHAALDVRTSVLTHVAWVPPAWEEAAEEVIGGLAERHPSRTIMLYPRPESGRDGLDAAVEVEAFAVAGADHHVVTEVVRLRLHGGRAEAPASLVAPLLLPDLPAFLRWRGDPAFGEPAWEGLIRECDRLVVDSDEWAAPAAGYSRLAGVFDRTAVSDLAWSRLRRWREALAARWPGIRDLRELRVRGPHADALLLHGWLCARLARDVVLRSEDAAYLERVEADGEAIAPAAAWPATPSDLLSDELDVFGRDPIYEEAVSRIASVGRTGHG